MMRRPLIVALLCAAAFPPAWADHGPSQRERRDNAGWPVDGFALHDLQGTPFDPQRLHQRWTLLLFGDLRRGEASTPALRALAELLRRIDGTAASRSTQIVFVTLDPQRDTPQGLRSYLAAFDPRFTGVTGPAPEVHKLAEILGASGPTASASDLDAVRVIGPDGVLRTELLPPFEAARLTAAFLKTRARG